MFTTKLTSEQNMQILTESKEALRRITESSERKKDLLTEMRDNFKKFDHGKFLFEEFDVLDYEAKSKVDLMYYSQLLQKLDESHLPKVQEAIISLYKDIRKIYETINIKPEIYGNNIDTKIINESIEESNRLLSKVIVEYINKNFYELNPTHRKDKYYDCCVETAKQLISEGTNPEDAISFSVKSVVVENLLRHIAFPFAPWSRIKYLSESESYGQVFDQDKLISLIESFNNKVAAISKVISAVI